jgi:hypothetical protein
MRPRPARPPAVVDTQTFRALLEAAVAEAGADDDSVGVALARGILAKTCSKCGADLDDAGRRDPARLCPTCRPAPPLIV